MLLEMHRARLQWSLIKAAVMTHQVTSSPASAISQEWQTKKSLTQDAQY
jgi:hypothetical protein